MQLTITFLEIPTFGFLGFSHDPQEMVEKLESKGALMCFHHWQDLPALLQIHHDQTKIA
jgi:hypothetical protein